MFSHLFLGLPRRLFPLIFLTKVYAIIPLDVIITIICDRVQIVHLLATQFSDSVRVKRLCVLSAAPALTAHGTELTEAVGLS